MSRYQVDIGGAIVQAGTVARHEVGHRIALDFSFRDAVALAE
jgi:hypothetical protein